MPSTIANAPEFRTQKRSPTTPRIKISPAVAPYPMTFPAITFSCEVNDAFSSGRTTMRPPEIPFPT